MKKNTRMLSNFFASIVFAGGALAGPVDEAMNADRAFAKMAQDKDVAAAFGAYAAPEALKFNPGAAPDKGPAAIMTGVAKGFADGGKLYWEPKEGVPSADGSMVVVWGRWTYSAPKDDKGVSGERHGTYLTVWAKQADGSWKYTHDIGNADPKPR